MLPIPQPKLTPVLRNLPEIDTEIPIQSLMRLARIHGPIFRFSTPQGDRLVVSSQELVDELSDEKRFDKKVQGALREIRNIAGDGLFTAETEEPNWGKAHRILATAFGPAALRSLFPGMLDIAEQLLVKWERLGEDAVVDAVDNMTRLTLDTISLCAFDYRFNSFYQNEMHPFVDAMVRNLAESGARTRRLTLQNKLMVLSERQYASDARYLQQVAQQLVDARRKDPDGASRKDLLNLMLQGKDPATGEGLSDENIRFQMVTFLIAGHETTSGLLSFALYALLKHPEILAAARAEVDAVLGDETPRFEHLGKLLYVDQVLKETLRLWPTAPAYMLYAKDDAVLARKYAMKKGEIAIVLTPMLHRDPKVWAGDVEAFQPARFAAANAAKLPPNAWKPFGNGQRACIGRPFAMQEAVLVLATVLQRFDLVLADPSYELRIKETLTLKPDHFYVRARRRGVKIRPTSIPLTANTRLDAAPRERVEAPAGAPPLLVLFGSNSGSCEAFAQTLAGEGAAHGFNAQAAPLDEYAGRLPAAGAVVVISASYEGQAPDNAKQFFAWLEQAPKLQGVVFAVFGCGNRDWARTYQFVPKALDAGLARAGGERLVPRGEADARGDFFGDFDAWRAGLWPALAKRFDVEAAGPAGELYEVDPVHETRSVLLRLTDLQRGEIVGNRELVDMSSPLGRSKRHIEIALPPGMTYRSGDYLAVLPTNPRDYVLRALRRFGYDSDSQIVVRARRGAATSLPTERPVGVSELLANYVELAQPATRRQVETLAALCPCPPETARLAALQAEGAYEKEVLDKRVSVLDLLEQCPSCTLRFAAFLAMLPPMRVRQYSISSSPLWREDRVSLTVAVVNANSWSGQGTFRGAASSYLAGSPVGARVAVGVRPSNLNFHLPADPEAPIIMVCAGTGLAPFRGFVQERAAQKANGLAVGPALLFFGCDHPDVDYLYRDELEAWERAGVVSLRPAFSSAPAGEVAFVQHRVWQDRADVVALVKAGARIYVCGDGRRMAPAVREALTRIYQEEAGCSAAEAEEWTERFERSSGRYVTDVFS